ncbi:hypothetical protein G9A89_017029 [Geosiphon pyriformis]|nr:hypothetical protein G9A89_017029 [Geosiphon pyriformis]
MNFSNPVKQALPRVASNTSKNTDGQFNHAHMRNTKHLEFLDKWGRDSLPDDDITVPLKLLPTNSEDGEDANTLAEQSKAGKKWNDLALNFLNDDSQRQPQGHHPHQQQSQQIQ